MKAKVCHFSSAHKYNDSRIFEKECCAIAKAGYETYFVTTNVENQTINDVRIIGVKTPTNRISRMLIGAYKIYRKAKKIDAKIYHLHDPELLIYGCFLKLGGKIVIYDAHEDLPQQILSKGYIPIFFRKILSKIIGVLELFFLRRFNFVVSATPFIENKFKSKNINSTAICNYPVKKSTPIKNYFEREKEIVYIGAINIKRGINELIAALNTVQTKTVKCFIAGSFQPYSLYDFLKSKLKEKCNYLGIINKSEINSLLNDSKIGIVALHPTNAYIHSLPIKMFEYMQFGIPIIASDFPLWKAIVEKHKCGIIVNPLNPNEIAGAIDFLLNNPIEAQAMGENGRRAVMTEFNWEQEEKKLLAVYKKLLATNE